VVNLGSARPSAAGRDMRLDLLRGVAVFAMIVDHLGGPSPLYVLTGGNRFATSAAEAFIFISGLLVGQVYRRIAATEGLSRALMRLLERAWALYVVAIGLTLLVLSVSEVLELRWARGIDLHDAPALVWSVLTLHQSYHLVDVPLLYALLLAAAPLALLLLHVGRTGVLLGLSWSLWLGFQLVPDSIRLPWPIQDNDAFELAAWQALFFTAMALGYHRDALAQRLAPVQRPLFVFAAVGVVALAGVALATVPVLEAIARGTGGDVVGNRAVLVTLQEWLFAKPELRPGRILGSAALFVCAYGLVTRFQRPILRWVGWLFLPFGQHALYAYVLHVLVAVGIAVALPEVDWGNVSARSSALVQLFGLCLIWLAIRFRVLYPTPETRRWWMVGVAGLVASVLVVLRVVPLPAVGDTAPPTAAQSQAARVARTFGTPVPIGASDGSDQPSPGVAEAIDSTRVRQIGDPIPYIGALHGVVREREFRSAALQKNMAYYVYLPPEYDGGAARYPVVYLLHGIGGADGGTRDEWLAYGIVDALDGLIAAGEVQPMIMVLPQGDSGYWVNWPNQGPAWGDYVTGDLVQHVDTTYRTFARADRRAIGGLSMGGAGALQLAFTHPNVFGVVGAHSPSLHQSSSDQPWYGTGLDFVQREPISLAGYASGLDSLHIWIDAGEDDLFLDEDRRLDALLTIRGIAHTWQVLPGAHESPYWLGNVARYVRMYDASFRTPDRAVAVGNQTAAAGRSPE
jgi:enterochelin esterase-like enzyme